VLDSCPRQRQRAHRLRGADILTNAVSSIDPALSDKIGRAALIHQRALPEHGLYAFQLLAEFDAEVDRTGDFRTWSTTLSGRRARISGGQPVEIYHRRAAAESARGKQRPLVLSRRAGVFAEVLPWLLAGKIHPSYARMITDAVRSRDTRLQRR